MDPKNIISVFRSIPNNTFYKQGDNYILSLYFYKGHCWSLFDNNIKYQYHAKKLCFIHKLENTLFVYADLNNIEFDLDFNLEDYIIERKLYNLKINDLLRQLQKRFFT